MRPIDSVAARAIALEEMENHVLAPGMMDGIIRSMRDSATGNPALPYRDGTHARTRFIGLLRRASLFHVNSDMMTLAVAAAESLPDDASIERQLPPAPTGWMTLETPLSLIDIRGKVMRFNAVSWEDLGPQVEVVFWADKYDPLDATNIAQRKKLGDERYMELPRWQPADIGYVHYDEPLPMQLRLKTQAVIPPETKVIIRDDADGNPTWIFPENTIEAEDIEGVEIGPSNAMRAVTVIWRLMRQTLAAVQELDPKAPKHLRRSLERLRITGTVTVVQLRRRESSGNGSREIEWSHRWLVKGHWRRQHYKHGVVEWIFIAPFVKGPDGAPLILKDTVYALMR